MELGGLGSLEVTGFRVQRFQGLWFGEFRDLVFRAGFGVGLVNW